MAKFACRAIWIRKFTLHLWDDQRWNSWKLSSCILRESFCLSRAWQVVGNECIAECSVQKSCLLTIGLLWPETKITPAAHASCYKEFTFSKVKILKNIPSAPSCPVRCWQGKHRAGSSHSSPPADESSPTTHYQFPRTDFLAHFYYSHYLSL